ncbi:TatD family hydrolase [Methanocaldococcus indicus]|uniref:TatD family hydrolase n=1 Tax=Methanocaldococcus indicus TaxID=213231 RepID=UPI003C6CFD81
MIDAHTHLDVRSFEDLENMAIAGIEKIITLSHDPYKMSVPEVYLDLWDRLINLEVKRGKIANVEVKVGIGVHPMGYPKNWERLIKEIPKFLDNENVVCIGETGLHYLKEDEINLLKEQLYIAKDYKMPIVIHTPEKNKKEALLKILEILDEVKIKEDLVMIDHLNEETVDLVEKYYIGLTVQSLKLTPERAAKIIKEYNKKFILSSDLGSLKSDIYALPKTKLELKKLGVDENKINKSLYLNAKEFYRL